MYLRLIILFIAISQLVAQTGNRSLLRELVKDMQRAIYDSTTIEPSGQLLVFTGDTALDTYLNKFNDGQTRQAESGDAVQADSVRITLISSELSLNREHNTFRNTDYVRQLAMHVIFDVAGVSYSWQGRISDKPAEQAVNALIDEEFPIRMTGNYQQGEPLTWMIILTTMSIFSLVAALFFIRT